ncbi:conjugative transposon protein TraN [Ornithobacterium rhinotracheale]|uniref:Bacteroides conjugative transposon TraN protein n=1 Tax=Ornithobacterium rhinotracheale (strain ATCC 51463 / DSM 15997 / CCUG 23171 / CIP 104009 / LMG 9086) TaxID=867902 RepID=I4A2H9_ORNRL|nr:conjugative transposon protein TraN [Ornithobacterium rhinotracheale]AFL98163.1 Bacteroides conjugative transposon TraN protein [Ornithobacterium rhinotracheale DSM 15997]AIP99915.1 conjugate transposon protein [Ornithobacterium rhinotracheale ORT-UMN 88]KGB66085.1 conjugate transposon protein [Ornithobacterium rhinotracheale H06-030791]MBN3661783.1 conjugative transposon protein TraN [Ornithobacterium rhinotracheale]MCK0193536.1 conjugative transposon protein TraN [Ornithobacterium rhinotr
MKSLHPFFIAIFSLTVGNVNAQTETPNLETDSIYYENDTISETKVSEPVTPGKIEPYFLEVAYDKTTHLIFPSPITYVDLGSENLIADKAQNAENVLRVKAATPDFLTSTNLSVITQDGRFYHFDIFYNENPSVTTMDFKRIMNEYNIEDFSTKTDILFTDIGNQSPAVAQLIMESIYQQKRNFIKHIGSKNAGIQFLLRGIYVYQGKLYFDIRMKNRSSLPYQVDFITFKIVDKSTGKKEVAQEIPIQALRTYQELQRVEAKSKANAVYMLEQLTLDDDKLLKVEIFEKNGRRYQSFNIGNEDLIYAREIQQFNLKL